LVCNRKRSMVCKRSAQRATVLFVGIESFDTPTLTDAPFSCDVQRRGRTSEVLLEGELDLAAKPVLDEALAAALEPGPVAMVIVDLTRVSFADSTTMTWLVQADHRTSEAGGRLVAVAGPGPVLDVLHMTGIDELVTVVAVDHMR
jgi:anti-sigma B factor antagonist